MSSYNTASAEADAPSPQIERAFGETCKILFGAPTRLRLQELESYLKRYQYKLPLHAKSALSGKEVVLSSEQYAPGSKFLSLDEVDFERKYPPLDINQLKDLDSLVEGLGERFHYAGNKIFGHSEHIGASDNCLDSSHVFDSHDIRSSKFVAYSAYIRDGSEYAFGCSHFLDGHYTLKFIGGDNIARCFESYYLTHSSDMYFSAFCHGCENVLFSFNLRSKHHCIGNLPLEKDKYFGLKKKLLAESLEYLENHKSFYSIFDFPMPSPKELESIRMPRFEQAGGNLKPVENAFRTATKVILGKELGPLDAYAPFLSKRVDPVKKASSAFGNEFYYSDYFLGRNFPPERLITTQEAAVLSDQHVQAEDDITLAALISKLGAIAFFAVDFHEGSNHNNIQCPLTYHSSDGYKVCDNTFSKNVAYDTHPSHCEAVFGSSVLVVKCRFCLRCHNCTNLTACMDCDSCTSCSDCLFCHNCENLENCMFCFNAKGLRYAIGNVEVGKEKYLQVKKLVQEDIVRRLERDKRLDIDIYNIGASHGHQ